MERVRDEGVKQGNTKSITLRKLQTAPNIE